MARKKLNIHTASVQMKLFFLILFAAFIYLTDLGDYHVFYSRDEASVAYNAYSILKTGRDEWGAKLPLHFKGPGDYPPGFAFYATVPFIAIFGLNEFASRLPAALAAICIPIAIYLTLKRLNFNQQQSFIAAGTIIFIPAMLINARTGSEVVFAFLFSILAMYALLSRKSLLLLLFSFLAMLSYLSTRLYLPLVLILTLMVYRDYTRKTITTIILVMLLSVGLTMQGHGSVRFNAVSIFNQPISNSLSVLAQQDGNVGQKLWLTRMFHNKYIYTAKSLIHNSLDYISPAYLFTSGGNPARFRIANIGILSLWMLPFLILGFLQGYVINRKKCLYMLGIFFISLLPAIITVENHPNIRRSFFALLPLAVWITWGIEYFLAKGGKLAKYGLIAAIIINSFYIYDQFIVHTQFDFSLRQSADFRRFMADFNLLTKEYDHVYFTSFADNPYIFLAFYNRFDPSLMQLSAATRPSNFANVDWSLGKITFVGHDCPFGYQGKNLYIGKGGVCLSDQKIQSKIQVIGSYTSIGTPIYDVYTDFSIE